ncbi:ABC transporter substrate-binding protein [Vulcanococcus limneticus]|uniref:ABC transporter substrate-binding protein n=1 Tax=Vulcanococcus limneticus TaxID=2170428 RepID=UPI00398BF3ED
MKRREILGLGLIASGLAACRSLGLPGSGGGNQAPHDLQIWWSEGYYPEETDAIERIFTAWSRLSGKKLNLTFFSENEITAKAQSAVDGGPVPDILYGYGINDTTVPVLSYRNQIVSLNDIIRPIKNDLLPGVIDGITYLNRESRTKSIYGAPLSQHSVNLHYWRDLLEEAIGTDDTAIIPKDWNGFWRFWFDCQSRLRGKGYDDVFGLALPMSSQSRDTTYIFEFFLEAHGAQLINPGGKFQLDDADMRRRVIAALRNYTDLYKEKAVPPKSTSWSDPDNNIHFLSSLSLMTANPTLSIPGSQISDEIAYFERLGSLRWPSSLDGQQTRSFNSIKQAVVFQGSNAESARSLLAYLLKPENLSRYVEGSQGRFLPITKTIIAMPFWHNERDQHIQTAIKNLQVVKPPAWILNPAYSAVITKNIWGHAIESIATGSSSAVKAADQAIADIRDIVQRWG